ncbi:MAG: hypothetical protein ACRBDI_10800 [Alphaproteobacteria bacterium]
MGVYRAWLYVEPDGLATSSAKIKSAYDKIKGYKDKVDASVILIDGVMSGSAADVQQEQ